MKRFLIFALIMALMAVCFVSFCSAEDVTETAAVSVGISYSEKEQIVRDVLENLLEEGDKHFAEREPWVIFSEWVRAHLGEIIVGVAGFVSLAGALLWLLRTNPKFQAKIEEIQKQCSGWLATISNGYTAIKEYCLEIKAFLTKLFEELERNRKANLLIADTLLDVIKLSGADESKKDIYIKKAEKAKALLDDNNDHKASVGEASISQKDAEESNNEK